MRSSPVFAAFVLMACAGAVSASEPQTTATMKISGVPGQIAIPVDQTDWSQIPGLPDPTAPRTAGSTNPLSARGSNPLASRGGTLGGGGGGGGGVAIQDLSITKYVDGSSPNLLTACANGQHFPEVEIEFVATGGNNQEYLVIEMENVIVQSVNSHGSAGDAVPTEELTFSCEKVSWEYRPIEPAQRTTPAFYSFTPTHP